jgi:hypothetical protein
MGKITTKRRKFVTGMAKGLNAGDAALTAGFRNKAYGYYLKQQDSIKSLLMKAMEKAGVTEDLIAEKMKEGMNALTVPKHPQDNRRFEDHFIRKQFLEMAIKIRGDFAPEKVESIKKEIKLVIDSHLIEALKDSKVIDAIDVDCIDALEVTDGNKMDSRSNFPARFVEEISREEKGREDNGGGIGGSVEDERKDGETGAISQDIGCIEKAQESQENNVGE